MEFYGSIDSVSGSITASLFTGSFKGDGGGLYNLPASGVTGLNLSQIASGNATASISSTGFTVNKNTQIQGDLSVTGSIIATNYIVSSSVTYMTTSFASGSSMFGNDSNDVHQFTGSVAITGSITLNGQAIGTGKLDELTFNIYTGSNQLVLNDLQSATSSLSSSIGSLSSSIALTDVSQSNRITNIENTYATTGSNLFKGNQTISGSIIPSVSGSYDLGDVNHPFRHLYLSSASLYIDGTKVLGSTTQELQITTDNGQSFKILESGTDSITLQSSDGDIQLKASGGGNVLLDPTTGLIDLRGTIQVQDGNKFRSSGGTQMVFGDNVDITGSLRLTGTIQGVDLLNFSSSVSASINSLLGGNTSLSSSIATTTSGLSSSIGSLSSSVATTTSGLSSSVGSLSSSVATTTSGLSSSIGSLSSSVATTTSGLSSSIGSLSSSIATTTLNTKNRVDSIETTTGSLNTFSSSINTTIKSKLDSESVISGSAQVIITGTTGYSTFSSSVSTSIGALSSSVATTTSGLSSSVGSLSSSVATTTSGLSSSIGSLSSSVATTTSGISTIVTNLSSSVATTTSGLSSSIGSLSSSVATTTSGLSSSVGSLSSSVATTTLGTKNRVDSIETKTGSFATTGSNIFQGNQTITGSLYISQDLIVAGSSSIQNISSSTLNIGTSIITVNTLNPSARFGGIAAIDSGSSPSVSGSFLFDSIDNEWIFVHKGTATVTSSTMITGPETYNNLGNETHLTDNRVPKTTNGFHIVDSNITDSGTLVSINSNTEITGTLKITSTITGTLSGNASTATSSSYATTATSSSYSLTATSAGSSTSSTTAATASYVAGANVSGNITGNAATATSSSYATTATSSSYANTSTSSSYATTAGSAGSSTSSTTAATASYVAGANVSGNISGNAATATSSSYATTATSSSYANTSTSSSYSTTAGTANAVAWSNISSIPSGIVSSSAQTIANLPSGTVSGSAQVLNGTTIHSGSFFNGISVVSGSAQISFGGITGVPSGLVSGSAQTIANLPSGTVSGSAQISLASTTGFGTYLNQAVLTTSTPTFSTVSATTFTGALSGNASTVSNGVYTNVSNTITGGRLIVGYSEASEPFVNGHFYNTNTTASQQYGGLLVSGINQAHLRFQVGTNTWSASGAKQWQIRVGNGTGADEFGIYSWTKGSNTMTVSSNGDTVVSGNLSATNLSGTNTGDQTLSGLGGLSNNTDSEQTVGGKSFLFNSGAGRMNADPRWNESGYDADLGCLHLWSWTAAGVAYGRAGIAFYNDNAYQYLTTKSNTTGLFVNNSLILTAGNYTSYAMAGAGYSANQNLNTSNSVRFTSLGVGGTNTTASHVNINGGNYNQFNLTYASSGWGLLMGYGDGSLTTGYHGLNHAAIINIQNGPIHFGTNNSSNIQVSTSGHLHPSANNTYDCGTASLAWRNVYTNDLHLSNMNKPEGNDIDGTNGNWTIQEGAEQLYIINNNNGKKFKIDLTEII